MWQQRHRHTCRPLLTCTDADALPLERLDWAIAGVSSSSSRNDGSGGQIAHSIFYHWVDSRTADPESATDEGDMFPQDDGTTLETGSMVNPATGRETQYEELWHDVDPTSLGSAAGLLCAVLKLEDGTGSRGMAILLGKYCQGFRKSGDQVSIERWEWNEQTGWKRTARMGQHALPCSEMTKDNVAFGVDETVETEDGVWTVVEIAKC